jgi:hypothetical protein
MLSPARAPKTTLAVLAAGSVALVFRGPPLVPSTNTLSPEVSRLCPRLIRLPCSRPRLHAEIGGQLGERPRMQIRNLGRRKEPATGWPSGPSCEFTTLAKLLRLRIRNLGQLAKVPNPEPWPQNRTDNERTYIIKTLMYVALRWAA